MKYLICLLFISCSSFQALTNKVQIKAPSHERNEFFPLWFKNNDPSHQTGNLPIATNWPLISRGIVYVGDNRGFMRAYELESGRDVWKEFDAATYSASPVVYKDQIVYGTTEGRVFSRHKLNGKIKYKIDLGSSIETRGSVYKGIVFFHLRDHKLVALDVETGKVLWAYKRSVPYLTTVQRASRPLILKNKVYVGFADGFFCSFRMEDGVLLWEKKISEGTKFVDADLTPVAYNNDILVGSLAGFLTRVDPKTGAVKKRYRYNASRAPFIYKKLLVVGTTGGDVIFLGANMKEIAKVKVSDLSISSIKEWKDYFVVSTVQKRVHLIRKKDFKVHQYFDLGHITSAVFGDLEVSAGHLAFLSSRNRLYVFK